MKKVQALFLVLVLAVFATAAYAAPTDPGQASSDPGFQGRTHHQSFWSHLDLSKEQKEKMHDVWSRYKADTHDLKYDLMGRRVEMRKLFTDPKVDQAALLAKEKELAALRQKMAERRVQAGLEWRSILTPEQIQKLDGMPHRRGMGRGFGVM